MKIAQHAFIVSEATLFPFWRQRRNCFLPTLFGLFLRNGNEAKKPLRKMKGNRRNYVGWEVLLKYRSPEIQFGDSISTVGRNTDLTNFPTFLTEKCTFNFHCFDHFSYTRIFWEPKRNISPFFFRLTHNNPLVRLIRLPDAARIPKSTAKIVLYIVDLSPKTEINCRNNLLFAKNRLPSGFLSLKVINFRGFLSLKWRNFLVDFCCIFGEIPRVDKCH